MLYGFSLISVTFQRRVYAVSRIKIAFNVKYWRERKDLCQGICNIKTRSKDMFFALKSILIALNDSFLFKIPVEKMLAVSQFSGCARMVLILLPIWTPNRAFSYNILHHNALRIQILFPYWNTTIYAVYFILSCKREI
jgi:hypothetical protein